MNRRKLFYVPGLLSLIRSPVLLYWYPIKNRVLQNCIRMNLPSGDRMCNAKDGILPFSHAGIIKKLAGKKVEQDVLTTTTVVIKPN